MCSGLRAFVVSDELKRFSRFVVLHRGACRQSHAKATCRSEPAFGRRIGNDNNSARADDWFEGAQGADGGTGVERRKVKVKYGNFVVRYCTRSYRCCTDRSL